MTRREERDWAAYVAPPNAQSTTAPVVRQAISTYINQAGDSTSAAVDTNAYSHPDVYNTPRNLLVSMEVQDGSGVVAARSQFGYTATGNLTDEYHWDSTKAGTISSGTTLTTSNAIHRGAAYSANGSLVSETDPRNKTTGYGYSATDGCASDLYRTSMTRGGDGSVAQTFSYKYNCNSGLRTETKDPNTVATVVEYDRYGRPKVITEGTSRKTAHEYNDASRWIVTRNDAVSFADQNNVLVFHFDQLGRVKQSRQLETAVPNVDAAGTETLGIRVDTVYKFSTGRNAVLVSNPYRALDGAETTRGWTVTRRDAAGRVCLVETFAGALEPAVGLNCSASSTITGKTSHSYSAHAASTPFPTPLYRSETVTDAEGAARTLYYDVLGRLKAVLETPASAKYATYYSYDPLDNLTQVRQAGSCANADILEAPCGGGLTRTFDYTSLRRLKTASNPESGVIQYTYDDAGNLLRREQGTVVRCAGTINGGDCGNAGYDDLNRLLKQSYSDETPTVTFGYDTENASNRPQTCPGTGSPIGRLSSVSTSNSSNYYYYTALGYARCHRQLTGEGQNATPYDFSYSTSPQGTVQSITYPSGRVVNSSLDHAGRATAVTSGTKNYASGIQYAPHGAVKALTLWNNLTESWTHNSRLQPAQLQAGSMLKLDLYYCPGQGAECATNNGNFRS